MTHGLPAANTAEDEVLFLLAIGRDDHPDRASDGFLCGVAKHALGCGVPRLNNAVEVLADDRVVRRFDDLGGMTTGEFLWGRDHKRLGRPTWRRGPHMGF